MLFVNYVAKSDSDSVNPGVCHYIAINFGLTIQATALVKIWDDIKRSQVITITL